MIAYGIALTRYSDFRSGYRVRATYGKDCYLDLSYRSLKNAFFLLYPYEDLIKEWKEFNLWNRISVAVRIILKDIRNSKSK